MDDFQQYKIDFENGTIPIGDLPIGTRVTDLSWVWEHRTGGNYSGSGEVKPIIWIIVAKNHYGGLEPHMTLLAEELIALHAFDNSTNRAHVKANWGYNHWGDSGSITRGLRSWLKSSGNATRGLRPWLNSTGIHAREGFYRAFSDSFKEALLISTIPNKNWEMGSIYDTQDMVFIPSTTELGDTQNSKTYQIGIGYTYFQEADKAMRVAKFGGEPKCYWTRSPDSLLGSCVRSVYNAGELNHYTIALNDIYGVRPALNLKSEILVSEIKD